MLSNFEHKVARMHGNRTTVIVASIFALFATALLASVGPSLWSRDVQRERGVIDTRWPFEIRPAARDGESELRAWSLSPASLASSITSDPPAGPIEEAEMVPPTRMNVPLPRPRPHLRPRVAVPLPRANPNSVPLTLN